jgi:hypothetical protein
MGHYASIVELQNSELEKLRLQKKELSDITSLQESRLSLIQSIYEDGFLSDDNKLLAEYQDIEEATKNVITAIDNQLSGLEKGTADWLDLTQKKYSLLVRFLKMQENNIVDYTLKLVGAPNELISKILSPAFLQDKFGYVGKFAEAKIKTSDIMARASELSMNELKLTDNIKENNWAIDALRGIANDLLGNKPIGAAMINGGEITIKGDTINDETISSRKDISKLRLGNSDVDIDAIRNSISSITKSDIGKLNIELNISDFNNLEDYIKNSVIDGLDEFGKAFIRNL